MSKNDYHHVAAKNIEGQTIPFRNLLNFHQKQQRQLH